MSRIYVQSEGTAARRRFPVYLVDATDGITPETGESAGQPQISKAGGAWANTTATLTAIGNGAYYVELTATELDTLGSIQVRYKSANTAEFNMDGEVVAINIHDAQRAGLTALPAVNSGSAGGLITSGTGTSQLSVTSGVASANVTQANGVALQSSGGYVLTHDILNVTTIATLSSQTSFTLTAGSSDDNAYKGCELYCLDQSTAVQKCVGVVSAYTGSTKTVTLRTNPGVFTMATGDTIVIKASRSLQPTVDTNTLDVNSNGEAGLDWGNVGNQSTMVGLSATTIATSQVVASVTGAVGSVTGAVGSVTGAVGSVTGNVGGNVTGSVGSVVGAVGSVTGNVGGNVTGSVGSVTGNVGGNVVGSVGSLTTNNDKTGYRLSATGVDDIWDEAMSGHTTAGTFGQRNYAVSGTADSGSTTTMLDAARTEGDNDYWKGRMILFTSGNIAGQCAIITDFVAATDTFTFAPATTQAVSAQDYVILPNVSAWDDVLAEHLTSGSTGAALNAAGSAGDPWNTALPGAYGPGTAGKIVGDNLDATVSSRLASASYTAPDNATIGTISTNVSSVLAKLGAITGSGINTVLGYFKALLSKAASTPSDIGGTFDASTDATEAIRDRGDAAWLTATGFSTHNAADVWAVGTRVLTAGTNIVLAKGTGVTGFNDLDAAGVRSAVGLSSANLDIQLGTVATASALSTVSTNVSTAVTQTTAASIRSAVGLASANLDTQLGAAATASALTTVGNNVSAVKAKTDNLPSSVDGKTLQEWYQIVGAVAGGKLSGAQTGTEVFVGLDGTTVRVTASVDASGNRTAIVYG